MELFDFIRLDGVRVRTLDKTYFIIETEQGEHTLEIEISPKEYTQEEIEQLHKEAEEYLDSVILAENESFSIAAYCNC